MAEPVTLELLGEQMQRLFTELRQMRQHLETTEDLILVQGAIPAAARAAAAADPGRRAFGLRGLRL